MTPDPATRAREKADSLVTEWLDRWRGWVSLLKREAFVDLVDRIAAALAERDATLAEARRALEEIERLNLRCQNTGNPCGTDTRRAGYVCGCQTCDVWAIVHAAPAPQEREGETK